MPRLASLSAAVYSMTPEGERHLRARSAHLRMQVLLRALAQPGEPLGQEAVRRALMSQAAGCGPRAPMTGIYEEVARRLPEFLAEGARRGYLVARARALSGAN
jgi:hypothetical protein